MSDDFRAYNDDTVHNMWVDYTADQYEDDGVDSSNNYTYVARVNQLISREMLQQRIDTPATSVGSSEYRASCFQEQISRFNQRVSSLEKALERINSPRKRLNYQNRISDTLAQIKDLEKQLLEEELNGRNLRARNIKLQTLLLAAICLGIVVWACL